MILNLTSDYPDCFSKKKTLAVASLLDYDYKNNYVVSLNRVNFPWKISCRKMENGYAVQFFCLPYGFGLFLSQYLLSLCLMDLFVKDNVSFEKIVAHKLSVEGVLAYFISKKLDIPYSVALWGSSDKKYINFKVFGRWFYRDIYKNAKNIFPASPWILKYIQKKLGNSDAEVVMLPIVTENTNLIFKNSSETIRFVSVFNLDLFELKGFPNLLQALVGVSKFSWTLDVYGVGSDASLLRINENLKKLGLSGRVNLCGRVDNEVITNVLADYWAFLMPTTSETFGMVYVEALYSGIPILYSMNQGVDGYFDSIEVGVRVNPHCVKSIRDGVVKLVENNSLLRSEIKSAHQDGFFEIFQKINIQKAFEIANANL